MTTHEFANFLLSETPDIPFNFGTGIKLLDRGMHLSGPFTTREVKGVLYIDQDPNMGYTEAEKEEIFNLCLNKKNWRKPIDVFIDADVVERIGTEKIRRILNDQVGGGTEIFHSTLNKSKYRVTSPGYYSMIGS